VNRKFRKTLDGRDNEGSIFFSIIFCIRFVVMLYVLLITNLIAFVTFAVDKWKAVKHKRRISESSLLTVTFFGGTFGAVSAMLIFRHKVSKKSFLWKLGLILIVQLAVIVYFLKAQK